MLLGLIFSSWFSFLEQTVGRGVAASNKFCLVAADQLATFLSVRYLRCIDNINLLAMLSYSRH